MMSPLFRLFDSLVVKNGKLGISEHCCCSYPCCVKQYFINCAIDGNVEVGTTAFLTTIRIPNYFSLPAKVRMVGVVDDLLLKDGQPWPVGTDPDSAAYGFDTTWLENNRTFTIQAKDTRGGNIRFMDVNIYIACETSDFTDPPCDPIEVLSCN